MTFQKMLMSSGLSMITITAFTTLSTGSNLLLLSMSINASLQNDSYDDKKRAKYDLAGKKIRNGYADGSHSEIEVSQSASWGPTEIRGRGQKILKFMEERWDFKLSESDKEKILFLDFEIELSESF